LGKLERDQQTNYRNKTQERIYGTIETWQTFSSYKRPRTVLMEETLTYWQHFQIVHAGIRAVSWPILIYVTMGIFFFSILRSIFFYATARKFDEWYNASLMAWGLAALYYKTLANENEILEDERGKSGRPTLKGGHVLGGWADAVTWLVLGTIFIWLWPIIFIVAISFGPIQMSRNHFMRKKIFIAKLKGEELDI